MSWTMNRITAISHKVEGIIASPSDCSTTAFVDAVGHDQRGDDREPEMRLSEQALLECRIGALGQPEQRQRGPAHQIGVGMDGAPFEISPSYSAVPVLL